MARKRWSSLVAAGIVAVVVGVTGCAAPSEDSAPSADVEQVPFGTTTSDDGSTSVLAGIDFITTDKDGYLDRYAQLSRSAIRAIGDQPIVLRLGTEEGVGKMDMFIAPSGDSSTEVLAEDGTWITNCRAPEPEVGITCFQQHNGEGPWELIRDPDPGNARYQDWNRVQAQLDYLFGQITSTIENSEQSGVPISYSYAEDGDTTYLKITAERFGQSFGDGNFTESIVYRFSGDTVERLAETHNADDSYTVAFVQTLRPADDREIYFPSKAEQVLIDRSGDTPVVTPVE